jgi:hypothetical protein
MNASPRRVPFSMPFSTNLAESHLTNIKLLIETQSH